MGTVGESALLSSHQSSGPQISASWEVCLLESAEQWLDKILEGQVSAFVSRV